MSAPLTEEENKNYTRIIDGILAVADLQTITRKKIREGLQQTLGVDLSGQKNAIKSLIEARFDAISSHVAQSMPTPPSGTAADEASPKREHSATASGDDEIKVSMAPAKKVVVKRERSDEDADARLAAELQAQENRMARARTTRGGNAGGKVVKKVKAKAKATKKSVKRVRSDDDSEGDGSAPEKKRKGGGGFQKPFNLSYQLVEVVGVNQLPRTQVVKKLWEYIKANELQDPSNKKQINCDDKLQAVFKQARIDMFQMNKVLGQHLFPVEAEADVEAGAGAEAAE